MRIRRTLAAALMGATMLWTAAPALAASDSPTTPSTTPPAAHSPAPAAQPQTPAVQNPTPAPQAQVPASKVPAMKANEETRPGMSVAIKDLEQARTALQKETAADAKGHRGKALQSIDQALRELHLALQVPTK